jgi:serine phosphatase RsbU (regulator of sigma subunit)
LVTLFNLPTSSVFERKLKEAVDFQKLSQSVPAGQSEKETYEILIDSSMSAVFADAAWLEIKDGDTRTILKRGINHDGIHNLKSSLNDGDIKRVIDLEFSDNIRQHKVFTSLPKGDFRSIFALPILVKNEQIGALVLLQEVNDAFNREMVTIITTFVNQASITLENARLINEALENERYKEQLKIAKSVQQSLLPQQLASNGCFQITAYSMAADEVGGDYYDIIEHGEDKYSFIIGDVSGKGTSAAFHMAQMKGVFHSLSESTSRPGEFILKANQALSRCLEKSSFITASYYSIDTKSKEIEFVRAGHCPTLVYRKKDDKADFLSTKGMGLGIVRNSDYKKYVHCNTIQFESGDVVLLHTDGITEAKDHTNEQFGEERLKDSLIKHINQSPEDIKEGIINDLYQFLNGTKLEDDYTVVIIKFE